MGYRYRVDEAVVPGTRRRVDIAFTRRMVAVMVDGCFWHSCPQHGNTPKNNRLWWTEKLQRNVERDRDTDARLEEAGWKVVRIWEHVPVEDAVNRVVEAVGPAKLPE